MMSVPVLPIADPLLSWYDQHQADLPWRGAPPYAVWLSEIMLQQTQIDTVIPYYNRFLKMYPTIEDLAAAPLDDVIKQWEGLGYYSRARNLHKTAQIVSNEHQGQFPQTVKGLLALPGIGRYTAGAIASIAFGQQAAVLDGNVIRVLSRLLDYSEDVTHTSAKNYLWDVADAAVPEQRAGDYNQAVMELGQKICTPRNPQCDKCPVQAYCTAYANNTQSERPVKKKKAPIPHYDVTAGIIRNDSGQILIAQRPYDKILGGLWEFPGGKQETDESLQTCLQRELAEELAIRVEVGRLFTTVKHGFTHYKITLHVFECDYAGAIEPHREPQTLECEAWAWVDESEFDHYSFGKADRQVIQAIRERKNMLL